MSFSLITGTSTIQFPDTPYARQVAQKLTSEAARRATTQPFTSPPPRDGFPSSCSNQPSAGTSLDMQNTHVHPSNLSKTASCYTLLDRSTPIDTFYFNSPTPRDGFLSSSCSVQPAAGALLDTTAHVYPSNFSKTASCYTLLDICKFEPFNPTVEHLRGLCATSDLHCNDCGRPRTSFYEPPVIFINILPHNHLDVCKILFFSFTGSAADHVKELHTTSDLHCEDCDRHQMCCHKSSSILITILPQKYPERYRILSLLFTEPAADPPHKLCNASDLQPDDRVRLCTHQCLPPAIFMTVASKYRSEPWVLTQFPPHATMNNPLAQFQLCQSTSNECSSWWEYKYEYLYFRASSVSLSFQSGLGFQVAIIRYMQAPSQYLSIVTQPSNHFSPHTCHTYHSSQVRMNHQNEHVHHVPETSLAPETDQRKYITPSDGS